jgi:hypothetical protein
VAIVSFRDQSLRLSETGTSHLPAVDEGVL